MHFGRALLFTAGVGFLSANLLLAQRSSVAGRTTLPSSTAIGAGALTVHPSAAARSTAPAIGHSGYFGATTYSHSGSYSGYRSGEHSDRSYRRLPRSYFIAPYYYPFYDWGGGTDYSAAPSAGNYNDGPDYGGPDPSMDPAMANQAALGQQVQRLTDQVNSMMYGQQPPQQQAAAQPQPPAIPLTLVLRNGEHLQVQNYAVTNNTFWDFNQRGTRRIPMSNIDLAASEKATEASGGEFPQLDATR
ncbi:MAG: hypothetical protein JO051_18305 [Acidobacteriaceae bacterium]|nr:hypothetical protein [Acidobacteriaceae bacterium]